MVTHRLLPSLTNSIQGALDPLYLLIQIIVHIDFEHAEDDIADLEPLRLAGSTVRLRGRRAFDDRANSINRPPGLDESCG